MDENFRNHHRQFDGMDNFSPTPVHLCSDAQAEPPRSLGVPRNSFPDTTMNDRPSHGFMSQLRLEQAIHSAEAEVDDSQWEKASKPKRRWQKTQNRFPVTGKALEDRRRQARYRIAQGGWKPEIAKRAIEYVEKTVWYDTPSHVWGVFRFIREAEALGELCSDWKAIRQFLDENIHRFITYQAMEKDFKVPDYMIRKASQRRSCGDLQYPWLRSFIREYQGLGRTAAESLVQVYKDQGNGNIAGEPSIVLARAHEGGSSGRATAKTTCTMAMNISHNHGVKVPSGQTCQMTLNEGGNREKRQRTFDETADVEIGELTKKIKRESTEEVFMNSRDKTKDPGTCEVVPNEIDDGKARMHVKGRTLTVLFHGMRDDGDDESEHVQVYVPRTSKGVTINFL